MKNIEIKGKLDIDLASLEKEVSFAVPKDKETWLYLSNYCENISLYFELASLHNAQRKSLWLQGCRKLPYFSRCKTDCHP